MKLAIDGWDMLSAAGALLLLGGLLWFSPPLLLAAIGAVMLATGVLGAARHAKRRFGDSDAQDGDGPRDPVGG